MPHKVTVQQLDDVDPAGLVNGDFLQFNGTKFVRYASNLLIPASLLTTKGDLVTRTSSVVARQGVGSDGQVLTADSAQTNGIKWATPTSGMTNPMTTQDDIIIGGSSGTPARLAKGSDSQVLTVDPSTHHLVWATPSSGLTNPMTTAADIIVGGTAGTPARLAKGSDGQVLTVDPTTHLLVWSTPAGSGASTADHFVTTAVDGDLSANTVIPGLAGSPDVRAGGSNDVEFDSSSTTGWSSFAGGGAVTFDFHTTAKSMARMKVASNGAADKFGGIIHAVTPSVPYTVTARLVDCNFLATTVWPVLFVSDSSTAAGNSVYVGLYGGTPRDGANSNMQTFTGFGSSGAVGQSQKAAIYLRLIVTAANNITTQVSYNGFVWYTVRSGLNVCATAGYFGFAIDAFGADCDTIWDWARFT